MWQAFSLRCFVCLPRGQALCISKIMDPLFFVEMGIVAVIVAFQVLVFVRNGSAIAHLRKMFPDASKLHTQAESPLDGKPDALLFVAEDKRYSPTFRDIVRHTNAYLRKHQGAADLEVLEDMAERKTESHEDAIAANISLPLYIGLLCTFTGVIIGLIKIAMVGVSDSAIQSFIGGVLIGMIGSAVGLALTVVSNFRFKESKKVRDRGLYDYVDFLRLNLIPVKSAPRETPVTELRDNLAAFHEGFANYQDHMNSSLTDTLKLFGDLKGVFEQLRHLERGLNGVGQALKTHEDLIEKQVTYIDNYARKADAFARKLNGHVAEVDNRVGTLVDVNIKALENSSQVAFKKMDSYLSNLQNGERKAQAQALSKDFTEIRGQINQLQQHHSQFLDQMGQQAKSQDTLSKTLQQLNSRLETSGADGQHFTNSLGFRLFAYTGSAAFILAMIGGVVFVLNQLGV